MNEIQDILNQTRHIWNNYIFKLKFFHSYYKFDDATASNHFGQVLDHFDDSLHIMESANAPESFRQRYIFNISLLQTIFVHQDLIEEMHRIFKTNVNQGELNKDSNYKINRELRNELIGHPIRRKNSNGVLTSAVTLSYNSQHNIIEYARYHKSNSYSFEKIQYSVDEIILRHKIFLQSNLKYIFKEIQKSLKIYLTKINQILKVLEQNNFDATIRLTENYYETFQFENYLYSTEQIKTVYQKKDEHPRYQALLNDYLFDLGYHLNEMRSTIESITKGLPKNHINYPTRINDFHYEIGKLSTKRNNDAFGIFGGILRKRLNGNSAALEELNFMEANIHNEVDYYSSCNYLDKILTV